MRKRITKINSRHAGQVCCEVWWFAWACSAHLQVQFSFVYTRFLCSLVSRVICIAHFRLLARWSYAHGATNLIRVGYAAAFAVNAALLAGQWQRRAWTVPLHPLINAQHEAEQTASTNSQVFDMIRPVCPGIESSLPALVANAQPARPRVGKLRPAKPFHAARRRL